MCVRRGAHAGLIGEQASCNAKTHRLTNRNACNRSADSSRAERTDKDGCKSSWNSTEIHNKKNQSADQIQCGHHRNHLLGKGSDSSDSADKDKRCNDRHKNADQHLVQTKRRIERIADRVRLNHDAHDAECKDNCHCEEACKKLTKAALEGLRNVIYRSSDHMTVLISGSGHLRKTRFSVNRCHAKEGRKPHPENSSGAAADKSGRTARNIAGSNLCRNGRCQRLKGGHAFLSCLISL